MFCELCGTFSKVAQKMIVQDEYFVLCNDCKRSAEDINEADKIGELIKYIIDNTIKKKNDLQ
jgi:hypothetical protein